MFTKAALRRPIAAGVAILLGAAALVVAPTIVTAASATTSSPGETVLTNLNKDRVDASKAAFKRNRFMDDYAQQAAVYLAACNGCLDPHSQTLNSNLSGQTSFTNSTVKLTGGATSDRPLRAVKDFETTNSSEALGSNTYAAVGYVTKGTSSYVTLVTASFSSPPNDEIYPGTVTLPKVLKVGTPINPVIKGFDPAPPGQYGYTWIDGSNTVSTAFNYAPTSAEIGHKLKVIITDSVPGYASSNVTSALSTAVVIGVVVVASGWNVVGARNVGEPLSVNEGSGWKPTTPTFQWYRNGAKIPGATGQSYNQGQNDLGKKIDVKLTVAQSGYVTKTVGTSDKVATAAPLLTATPFPTITGSPSYGSTLTANTGDWGPGTVKLKYQWLQNGSAIKGATGSTFKLGSAQLFTSISVKVTGSESGYSTVSRTSAPLTDIAPLTFATIGAVSIAGTSTVGQTLKASISAWSPVATSYTYQWERSGVPISKATKSSYKLTAADNGQGISVEVVGSRVDYRSALATSSEIAISGP